MENTQENQTEQIQEKIPIDEELGEEDEFHGRDPQLEEIKKKRGRPKGSKKKPII